MNKVAFYTLGCKVNSYESDAIYNLLKDKGFIRVDYEEDADVYIINTCSVTNIADRKSRKIIRKKAKLENKIVCVMGCYSQTHIDEIKEIDGIDIIIGTKNRKQIVDLILKKMQEKNKTKIINIDDITHFNEFENLEVKEFEHTRAFMKIEDGCNNFCSYCIIPYARGRERSKKFIDCINEAKTICNQGYKEIVLTGIHSGAYYEDNKNFNDLLIELLKIENLERLRISSLEINQIDDKFLEILKNNHKLANHLHLPLQSGSDKILKLMNRKYNLDFYEEKINKIRNVRPDIAITTDIIVGFPNESDLDFKQTIDFSNKINFYEIHVFPYSKRENTVAANMPNQVSDIIKTKRANDLLMESKKLKFEYENKFINKIIDVIFEVKYDKYYVGHSSNYLKVYVETEKDLIGKMSKVQVLSIKDDKIYGKLI